MVSSDVLVRQGFIGKLGTLLDLKRDLHFVFGRATSDGMKENLKFRLELRFLLIRARPRV
jgi:hypothetical protein